MASRAVFTLVVFVLLGLGIIVPNQEESVVIKNPNGLIVHDNKFLPPPATSTLTTNTLVLPVVVEEVLTPVGVPIPDDHSAAIATEDLQQQVTRLQQELNETVTYHKGVEDDKKHKLLKLKDELNEAILARNSRINASSVGQVLSTSSTDKMLGDDTQVMKHTKKFCSGFVGGLGEGVKKENCGLKLQKYSNCTVLGAGNFGLGLHCQVAGATEEPREVVVKVAFAERKAFHFVRNTAKEAIIACQAGLLKQFGVLDTFCDALDFMWCDGGSYTDFLKGLNLANIDEEIRDVAHGYVQTAMTKPVETTMLSLGVVDVPQLRAPNLNYYTPCMLYEIYYTVIVFNAVLDYSVADLRTHHVGWKDVDYYRHYTTLDGKTLLCPPGKMVKLIDFGSYRTLHNDHPSASNVLNTAFFFSMPANEAQLDDNAKSLLKKAGAPAINDLPPLQALEALTTVVLADYPELTPAVPLPPNTRRYVVPTANERQDIANHYAKGMINFEWRNIKL